MWRDIEELHDVFGVSLSTLAYILGIKEVRVWRISKLIEKPAPREEAKTREFLCFLRQKKGENLFKKGIDNGNRRCYV